MLGSDFSRPVYSFRSTFAGIPVEIQYEIEVNEDHRGRDVVIIPTACVIGDHAVDLCEDAGFFHPQQLKKWLAQAEADQEKTGEDDSEPDDDADPWAATIAEDRWIAARERIHHWHEGR
jgi:hypothetical protein